MTNSVQCDTEYADELQQGALILCLDHTEARILRRQGYTCITSAKLRRDLTDIITGDSDTAIQTAKEAIRRIEARSDATTPEKWAFWQREEVQHARELRQAFDSIPEIPTPMQDPEQPFLVPDNQLWPCAHTTILVARDTFQLVQAADTYAKFHPYRHHGRMDEPFAPQINRVYLVTIDELKLVRLDDIAKVDVVLVFDPLDLTGKVMTTRHTYWPPAVRAICAEFPWVRIGRATTLTHARFGNPFYIGLTRGVGYETESVASISGSAAFDYCIETDNAPYAKKSRIVIWKGEGVHDLVRFGGLTIFIGNHRRRKVSLRSLGLIKSPEKVAGEYIYDMYDNYEIIEKWSMRRDFDKPISCQKYRNRSRVRRKSKASPEYTEGDSIIYNTPRGIKETQRAVRNRSLKLRNLKVFNNYRVATVPVKSIGEGEEYYLNGRPGTDKEGNITLDSKRWTIRCAKFEPVDKSEMLDWLQDDPNVIMSGLDIYAQVFAVIKVANGTEDQQGAAISSWCEDVGRRFPQQCGSSSWLKNSVQADKSVKIAKIFHTNWRAEAIDTHKYQKYAPDCREYAKPVRIERRSHATDVERAKAYVASIDLRRLESEGERNSTLFSILANVRDKFGPEAMQIVGYEIMQRCTLSEKDKQKMFYRILQKEKRG